MIAVGLDIGTTKLCGVALDAKTGGTLACVSLPNRRALPPALCGERAQDADAIACDMEDMLRELLSRCKSADVIGLTGQMHGILYLDADGRAASKLYTWQDGRGGLDAGGETYAARVTRVTGYPAVPGMGAVTHFYNAAHNLVPERARAFTTIHGYAAMRLAGLSFPSLHASDADGIGLFCRSAGRFDARAIAALRLPDSPAFPEIAAEGKPLGAHRGIPVYPAIGDNQAGFLGAVGLNREAVLVNVGTGSQLSYLEEEEEAAGPSERRPLIAGRSIRVGAALCGGRAYAILKQFYERALRLFGDTAPPQDLYERMNRAAEQALTADPLSVDTRFCGTRAEPGLTGGISGLAETNFTPEALTLGVLEGIAEELHGMYAAGGATKGRFQYLVGSGNGIRRNPLLKNIFERKFRLPMRIPADCEEAARGAALYALSASGRDIAGLIKYEE